MIYSLLAISEFATKLVAGLSGMIFAVLIIGLVFGIRNKKPKNINPEELKRKALEQQRETPEESKKSKKKNNSEKQMKRTNLQTTIPPKARRKTNPKPKKKANNAKTRHGVFFFLFLCANGL